jgi:hypothetical protein
LPGKSAATSATSLSGFTVMMTATMKPEAFVSGSAP